MALEGEKLCKGGNCWDGVVFFRCPCRQAPMILEPYLGGHLQVKSRNHYFLGKSSGIEVRYFFRHLIKVTKFIEYREGKRFAKAGIVLMGWRF